MDHHKNTFCDLLTASLDVFAFYLVLCFQLKECLWIRVLACVMLNSDLISVWNVNIFSHLQRFFLRAGRMRFKKGTKVEVLTKSFVPSGAWRSAEILSGNGHYYTVMYDGNDGGTTERVPRKSMRPEPPPLQVLQSWAPGDVLEVFESCSWKMAIVSKVLENDCFLVRLLGSSLKVRANKSDIRVRQSWQDNEWIMVGKVLPVSVFCQYIYLSKPFY